jgi:hypothetical protein
LGQDFGMIEEINLIFSCWLALLEIHYNISLENIRSHMPDKAQASKNGDSKNLDPKISLSDVMKVFQIFSQNGWFTKVNQGLVFEKLIAMLENSTTEQKDLIFELCERYLWVPVDDFTNHLNDALGQIDDAKIRDTKRIVLFPIARPADIGKIKSSPALIYRFVGSNFGAKKFAHIKFDVIDSYEQFYEENFSERDMLMLVDDFIGTGNTLEHTLIEIFKNETIKIEQLCILALVAQEQTINILQTKHFQCYIGKMIKKGISDYYTGETLERKIKTMQELEALIPKNSRYRFGYEKSEALVTMNRTPNNTFPIFWRSHTRGNKKYSPPFPRYYEE